ncbi:ABC-three component system protein [Yersinia enterocolitica]|uniref:Lipase n=1 Tax=Yersinia alsatica TaxID=2890317 RepID=A0ABY5UIR1_9GAMM|nr:MULTISPECIES: ABC-three component system protein [Yersinia]EKN5109535.1 hypothetical protein [Yersinia enterocolitica]OWF69221.1 hypothetical protein B4901_09535 [Yersinia frederiksenii]MBW5813127.1 hypothetical protein [Yersinia kristensenii]MBW5830428.1 hypothetical protein [Yersinia kristensenii]MBW5843273.1 hypothetical protein [Yersinia kristensenii]
MTMLKWIRQEKASNLVLFIHGLNGGGDTWNYSDEVSFPKLLKSDEDLASFDISYFEYFTNFTSKFNVAKGFLRKLFNSTNKIQMNLPVDELSELLVTEIDVNLSEYKNIIFVAHSMGGLVAKSCILKMIKYGRNDNIKGFISLAVPHAGSELASYSSMISSSAQIKDLKVFSDETDSLNREWLASNQTPSSKFIYGTNDLIVNKKSALPIQILAKDSVAVHEDHGTICKPSDTDNNVYKLVKRFILEIDRDNREPLVINDFVDENQYDNEYFVLKMIVADVHDDISNHAKEYYYNAELARNFFTSDRDRAILDGLYRKIKGLYQTQLQSAIANHLTADQLLSAIHKKIEDEDRVALNVLLSDFDNLYKKGMLHQLANKSNRDVIWSADTTLESLNQLRSSQ